MNQLLACLISISGITIYDQSPTEMDSYLTTLQADTPSFLARFSTVVHDSLGTPYSDGPLGEGAGAAYDADPIIDLTRVDCVTFVEQCAALAQSSSYAGATESLQRIRYQGGKIDYAQRNHFMIADWIPNNRWCRDITSTLGVKPASLTRTISKADFFRRVKAPDLGQTIPDQDVTLAYIPIAEVGVAARAIKQPVLVVFIGHVDWLFALHCGIYLPDGKGGGALYHASSKAGRAAAMDLGVYAAEQSKRYLGIAVYEIAPEGPKFD